MSTSSLYMHAHVQCHTDKHTCTYATHTHPPEQVNIKRICISGSGPVVVTTWETEAGGSQIKGVHELQSKFKPRMVNL